MRITRFATPGGNLYRVYRIDDRFHDELKRLLPFLRTSEVNIEVGGTDDDAAVLLTIGPFDARAEQAFRVLAQRHLAEPDGGGSTA